MPSDLIVDVVAISGIKPHPNADKLDIAIIKGWQVVVAKDSYTNGQMVVYFPPDCLIPEALAGHLGVTDYLSMRQYEYGTFGRVKAIKLRKEPSYGFAADLPSFASIPGFDTVVEGDSVAELLGIRKWEPPQRSSDSAQKTKIIKTIPGFTKYIDIQNLRNFPNMFEDGEEVIVTEKIHGTNSRCGLVDNPQYAWYKPWTWGKKNIFAVGSHNVTRKVGSAKLYDIPLTDSVKLLLTTLKKQDAASSVIVFSEIYGASVQDLGYGLDEPTFAVIDVKVDDEYLSWSDVKTLCSLFNVQHVPELYRGKYNYDLIRVLAEGKTMLMSHDIHIREGCVVKSATESRHPRYGRKIAKFVSDNYLFRKSGTEYH